jgi:hypothetical protein
VSNSDTERRKRYFDAKDLTQLTNSTEMSPSWEAASRSCTQEFPKILRNPKVQYCVLSLARSIQSKSRHPISLSSILILRVSYHYVWVSLAALWLSQQNHICIPLLTMRATSPSHPYLSWLAHPKYIWRKLHAMKLLIVQFSPTSYYIILFSILTIL